MVSQLSIFAANTKGAMNRMTNLLAEAGIDIDTLLTNDSAEFGIVRMIVSDTQKAKKIMEEAGYLCRVDRVIAVTMENRQGSLNRILAEISASNTNIDYLYISYDRETALPIAIFHTSGAAEVEECLMAKGLEVRV